MRVSWQKALENREQIVETAARLLRQHGFGGIGVADMMNAAGLTHGGRYSNFASKDDLAVKASEHAIAGTKALLKNGLAQEPRYPLRALLERYVSSAHRDDPGSGRILPALAADATRRDDPALRAVLFTAIQFYLDQIVKLSSAPPKAIGSRHPAAILSEMILSRVIADNPPGGPADVCCGGGYCRAISRKEIDRGVMQRGSRKRSFVTSRPNYVTGWSYVAPRKVNSL